MAIKRVCFKKWFPQQMSFKQDMNMAVREHTGIRVLQMRVLIFSLHMCISNFFLIYTNQEKEQLNYKQDLIDYKLERYKCVNTP